MICVDWPGTKVKTLTKSVHAEWWWEEGKRCYVSDEYINHQTLFLRFSSHSSFLHTNTHIGGWEKDKCAPVRLPAMESSIIHSVVSTQPKHPYIIQQSPPPFLLLQEDTHYVHKKRKNTHSSIWLKLPVFLALLHVCSQIDLLTEWTSLVSTFWEPSIL